MVRFGLLGSAVLALLVCAGSPLAAEDAALAEKPVAPETREAYLERLRDVCSVECLKPRDFRRAARKQSKSDKSDMALMMDVRDIRRDEENYLLL
ncbi:MAG: hypothetical protein AAFY81_11245, partial [Pseudomonadota bacterium]